MSRKKVCCLLRARKVRYCDRKEASSISKFRYIWGGEDGSVDVGSEQGRGRDAGFAVVEDAREEA